MPQDRTGARCPDPELWEWSREREPPGSPRLRGVIPRTALADDPVKRREAAAEIAGQRMTRTAVRACRPKNALRPATGT